MQRMATRPGFPAKPPFPHTSGGAGVVEFTVVAAVAFDDSDTGGSVGLWETVSLDVWLVVAV